MGGNYCATTAGEDKVRHVDSQDAFPFAKSSQQGQRLSAVMEERRVIKEGWFTLKSGSSWWPSWTDYWFSLYAENEEEKATLKWSLADDDPTPVDAVAVQDISNFAASLLLPGEKAEGVSSSA